MASRTRRPPDWGERSEAARCRRLTARKKKNMHLSSSLARVFLNGSAFAKLFRTERAHELEGERGVWFHSSQTFTLHREFLHLLWDGGHLCSLSPRDL